MTWLPRPWLACKTPFGWRWKLARAVCRIIGHSWEPAPGFFVFTCGRCRLTMGKHDLVEKGKTIP